MRLGLIGGTDSKRTSGVYKSDDVVALQDAKKYVTRFGYDGVFNALTSSGTEEGFAVSLDGTHVYVAVRGSRTSASIFQYDLSTPWDLSTIAYSGKNLVVGDYDINCSAVAISDDGTRLFFTGYSVDTVWSCTLATPYDLATATVDVGNFYLGSQNSTPWGVVFGNSGTKMYMSGNSNSRIYEYNLSTAWDVTTAAYSGNSLSVSSVDATIAGLFFRDDGTQLYVVGYTNDIILSCTLSTPWDISTGTLDYVPKLFSTTGQTSTVSGIAFGNNGSDMYVLSGGSAATDTVFQYTLSTPWDVTSAAYSTKSFSINSQSTSSTSVFLKNDGTKMYILDNTSDSVYQYSLGTPWDVSTSSYDSISFSVAGQETTPTAIFIGDNGTRMYIIGHAGDDVNEYSLSSAWDISTASYVRSSANVGEATPYGLYFSPDGTRMFITGTTGDRVRIFDLSTPWDVSTISFVGVAYVGDSFPTGIHFKDDGTEYYISADTNNRILQYSLSVPWDPRSIKGRLFVNDQDTEPRDIFIKPDGTKLYFIGVTGDDVNEYDLSTAWDISTATFVQSSSAVGLSSPSGLWFKDDGTELYVIGTTSDAVRKFSLSTPWDISTISFVQQLSVTFESSPRSVSIKSDGSILYVSGATNDVIYQISLGTPWDISTAKGFIYVGGVESASRGIEINNDGTLLFLCGSGSDNIRKFTLSTAYELGTATLSQSFASKAYGMHITADGLRIYTTVDNSETSPAGGRQIRQITLTSPYDLSTATRSNVELIAIYGLTGTSSTPFGVCISPDGTRMFLLSDVVSGMYQFSLRFV